MYKLKLQKLREKISEEYPSILDETEKIDMLIEIINEKANRFRTTNEFRNLFLPGLALGFIFPIWSGSINELFQTLSELVKFKNIEYLFIIFISLVFIVVAVILSFGLIRAIVIEILDKNYKKRKKLVRMLREMKLNNNN